MTLVLKSLALCTLTALSLGVLGGCGGSPQSSAARGDSAFRSASPELKAGWEKARTAVSQNDYAGGITNLQKLASAPGLTPEQKRAIQETATAVSDQMYAAANRGEPGAKKALEILRELNAR